MIHFVDAGPLVAAFRRPQDRDPVTHRKLGMILPLPFGRGEGRGEGSRHVVYPTVPSVRDSPVWILPCRMLRRKNVAEALLLTRWLRPEALLVTTGGASSADEQSYFDQIASAARRHGWPLRLGILQGDETHKPTVAELLAASEAVLLTSIQEGFGLPYLEAAAAGGPRPAPAPPNTAPAP